MTVRIAFLSHVINRDVPEIKVNYIFTYDFEWISFC